MAPHMSRTRWWLRLRGMTKVTARMSTSLDGCYAGPMDPRDPQDAARWMQGPEAPGDATSMSCRDSSATAPACTTSWAGPCASRRTWVGDDPNASTNLRFRATYEA
jgi:hypothetical protein